MISTEINEFINKIMVKTQNKELNWNYAYELFEKNSKVELPFFNCDPTTLTFGSVKRTLEGTEMTQKKAKACPAISNLFKYCNNEKTGSSLSIQDSFYLKSKNEYLLLLHIIHITKSKGNFKETWELFAIFDEKDETYTPIPDYHPAGESDRLKELCDLIAKNKATERDQTEKKLLNFFDSFL